MAGFVHVMKKILLPLAAGLAVLMGSQAVWADTCADLRAIHTQSASHFDGWKKDPIPGGYASAFLLDGASSCEVSGDSTGYSCVWKMRSPAELGSAYSRLAAEVRACPPLVKQEPGIINDKPDARQQKGVRQELEITGFDYGDAGVIVMVGQMRASAPAGGQARNELKFSFVRAVNGPGAAAGPGK